MLDFMKIAHRSTKRGVIEIYPQFQIIKSRDLMIRGGDFYAIWVEERGLWSTDEQDAIDLIDRELGRYEQENRDRFGGHTQVLYLRNAESGMIDGWHKYCQRQLRDNFHALDEKLIFANTPTEKKDYASKRLDYPLESGETRAWDGLLSVLYADEERRKIEWAIGAIVSGESKHIQKFMVFYGAMGTGKSTVMNIIEQLFKGYTCTFDAKALGSSNAAFALEAFRDNPLVAIQQDGDLSRIEDNTRLNSLVSHEDMTVNEKFKSQYSNRFKCFLFMGTNRPVKITDGKSGLIRRLIDVSPTGNRIPVKEYRTLVGMIPFELGHIASKCMDVYLSDPSRYDDYIPKSMMGASNDFYNFVLDCWPIFRKDDETTLKAAWAMYKAYCEDAKVSYPYSLRIFKEELKNYFREYAERTIMADGSRARNHYKGFRYEKFESEPEDEPDEDKKSSTIVMKEQPSILDEECAECFAQLAGENGTPLRKWENVRSTLAEIDTRSLHFVKLPEKHIVIDFDICDENGQKCFERNLEEASRWPPTYAEVSKSGCGIHLHYLYSGDVDKLSRVYDDRIEVKVFTGNSSLRRKLTICNDLPIATISSGLPLKEEKRVVNFERIRSEHGLRRLIKRHLNKEIMRATKPSVDMIAKILEETYESELAYDVTDMRPAILAFAAGSTNQSETCIKMVNRMKFRSKEVSEEPSVIDHDGDLNELIFYDVEVFPNLFLVNWKVAGEGKKVVRMIQPKPADIEQLMRHKLVGFNCRRYDNHILYARLMGYDNEQLYRLSQRIISGSANGLFGEAYNVSYTDVYDFTAKKQSLKKWEIELGIHHKELGLPWDQPVPEERWTEVAEYCDNDVIATEAVFNACRSDFLARQILADVAGMTVNDTTNSLTTRIIFGGERKPQGQFRYRNMGEESAIDPLRHVEGFDGFTAFDDHGRPIFPGYRFDHGVSTYRGEEVGEGGYVYAEPGMYVNAALLDITSMHPSSIIAEELFGYEYTKRFQELRDARIAIKHGDFDLARKMLGGALAAYLTDEDTAKDLAQALKIAINSVYGLTSAGFDNPFRDPRNKDNIVAKRGALFMINLKHEVQKRGYIVAHIKTDSIKIPNATAEIIQFVMDYGQMYGYTFEHEATYDRMCLVNDAVYVAKYKDGKKAGQWTATGTQFQVPYVFKTLFSREPILFNDLCETKSVSTAIYLDMNEALTDVTEREKELETLKKRGGADDARMAALKKEIEAGHCYRFIGKVGRFCPIMPGAGGGLLLRETTDKKTGERAYMSVTGAKGYRWLESEMVRLLDMDDRIDRRFYARLVDEAAKTMAEYGDVEQFISGEAFIPSDMPPWD